MICTPDRDIQSTVANLEMDLTVLLCSGRTGRTGGASTASEQDIDFTTWRNSAATPGGEGGATNPVPFQ